MAIPLPQLETFPFFSLLPVELQHQVWWEAARVPRFVRIEKEPRISQSIPGILHACRESRIAGLETYSLFFHNSYVDPSAHEPSTQRHEIWKPKPIYFSCEYDTLQFDSWPAHKCRRHWVCDAQDLSKITRLAVSKTVWMTTNRWVVWRALPLFKSVQELVLVVNESDGCKMQAVEFGDIVEWSFDGSLATLQAGNLRVAFMAEIEKMFSSGIGASVRGTWRPHVTVSRLVDGV